MSTTRLQEVQICFGFGKQTDIATANLVAAMWRLKKLNAQLATPKLNTENDAAEYGKGHELRIAKGSEVGHDAELHLHLHSADPVERRRHGVAVLLLRRADPARCGG